MRRIKLFSEGFSILIGKKIGSLWHYFIAGGSCISFLALFAYLLGIITNTVIGVFSWFNIGIAYSAVLLFGVILATGFVVNVFGSQKFAASNSFVIIMARSFMKLAEKIRVKDGFKAYKVPLSGLVGIDPIAQLGMAKAKLEIKELELRKKYPVDWADKLLNSDEFRRFKKILEEIEKKGNQSASICVFSVDDTEKAGINGLCSTTPTIITGVPFFDISSEAVIRVDTKVAVSEVTSGTLGK